MKTQITGTTATYYFGQDPPTCDPQGHVWTWDRDTLDPVTGGPIGSARCDCGAQSWHDATAVRQAAIATVGQ